jgi:hypothetical protein
MGYSYEVAEANIASKFGSKLEQYPQIKKVIFHLGPQKTGSTAIQTFFHSNSSILIENGFLYPEGTAGTVNHLEVLTKFKKRHWLEMLDDFIHTGNLKRCDTIIISSEEALFMSKSELAQLLDHLSKSAIKVPGKSLEIEFIFLKRRLLGEGRGKSLYRQTLMGGYGLPFIFYLPWLLLLWVDEKKKLKFLSKQSYSNLEIKLKYYDFKELIRDQQKFLEEILKLFGIPKSNFNQDVSHVNLNKSHSRDFYNQLQKFNYRHIPSEIKMNPRKSVQIGSLEELKINEFIAHLEITGLE